MNRDLTKFLGRLENCRTRSAGMPVLLGFDGTVDRLYSVVGQRSGLGDAFEAIPTIDQFGSRVSAAAGQSACLEIFPRAVKIGGNGPIMARALAAHGIAVTYIGPLGQPQIDPAFAELAERGTVYSVGTPAVTHALEFHDGKIMLPVLLSYEAVTAERIVQIVGRERLLAIVRDARLVAPLNWTCLPAMDGILDLFVDDLLPEVGRDPERVFFFDLADPAKHTGERIAGVLRRIARFSQFGRSVLGLNFSEAKQAAQAFGLAIPTRDPVSLQDCATALRAATGLSVVMIHPTECAACAGADGAFSVPGPVCAKPLITTGAGDHLNSGFCLGLLLGLSLPDCLQLGVLVSGYYVRTGRSPTLDDIGRFAPSAYA